MISAVTNEIQTQTMSDAARRFGQSLPPAKHPDGQEALRFARWFGEDRPASDLRPADLEAYVESFGAHSPNAGSRADSLKSFLAYAHKQKILPERLVSHVRVRRTQSRAKGSAQAESNTIELTAEGKAQLEQELEDLKDQRPKLAAELQAARADGDVRENAPLDAARETQGQIEARIRELEGMLRHAVVADAGSSRSATDAARIGSNIVISNLETGVKMSYQLVNAAEARPGTGRLSIDSPVGQAVLGKRAGDEVSVSAPSGLVRFKLESIEA
jgi:transcription elongation factor GreA